MLLNVEADAIGELDTAGTTTSLNFAGATVDGGTAILQGLQAVTMRLIAQMP